MSEIEKMKRYIERTNTGELSRYELGLLEVQALRRESVQADALYLAFLYGRAKGYRAAKAAGMALV